MSTKWRRLLSVLACLVLAGACNPGQVGGDRRTAEEVDLHTFGTPQEIGTGLLDGMTPDGSAAYVEDRDPQFPEAGCEGQPEPAMFLLPLGGGERTLVGGGAAPLHGRLIAGGSDGRIAVVAGCESFFQELTVARQSEDGTLSEVTPVTPAVPEGWLLNPGSMSWSKGGEALLAALHDVNAPDGEPSRIVSIDPASGELTRIFDAEQGTGVLKVGQMQNGIYAVAANLVVSFRDEGGGSQARFGGHSFETSPDRRRMVVYGNTLQLVEQGAGQATELLPEMPGRQFTGVSFSPDGRAVTFERYSAEGGHTEVGIVTLPDRRFTSVVIGGQYGRPFFSGDGRALAFNQFGSEPDFVSRVYLTTFETG